jgi:N-acetylneuraminic acid mutarotase
MPPASDIQRPALFGLFTVSSLFLLACGIHANNRPAVLSATELPTLPVAVANNAVVAVTANDEQYIVSFAGIASGLAYTDIHASTWLLGNKHLTWVEQSPLPGEVGRLAATAATIGQLAYVFGGYTVAANGDEESTPWVHSFNPATGHYEGLAAMPIPVDDAVSASYADRYIYLISGWHDLGNVNLVQRFDTVTNTWTQATPIPGRAVFGHAGGIVSNKLFYCAGVAVRTHTDRARSFAASDECYLGIIDANDSRRIDWRKVRSPPGLPRYRMAAAGIPDINAVLFIGGSENPYNFNGIGYNSEPSQPAVSALLFDLETQSWTVLEQDNAATMDHRGLVAFEGRWVTVGGMLSGQTVTNSVTAYALEPRPEVR